MEYSILNPLRNNVPFVDKSKIIFCMDCPRKQIWRREIYPEYKLSRDTKDNSKDEFNISRMFNYAYEILLPTFCETWEAKRIMCGCAEGDDVIAVLTNHFIENTKNDVIIISCDKDMVQLHNNRVEIITADGTIREPKQEMEKILKRKLDYNVTAKDFLLFKILIGDSADCIPNIKNRNRT